NLTERPNQAGPMKAYAVDASIDFTEKSHRVCTTHHRLFHGEESITSRLQRYEAWARRDATPPPPLAIIRIGHYAPDLFQIMGSLIVTQQVRDQLSSVPHVAFQRVCFDKLIDFPYYPACDFSYNNNPLYRAIVGRGGDAKRLLVELPDARQLHESF